MFPFWTRLCYIGQVLTSLIEHTLWKQIQTPIRMIHLRTWIVQIAMNGKSNFRSILSLTERNATLIFTVGHNLDTFLWQHIAQRIAFMVFYMVFYWFLAQYIALFFLFSVCPMRDAASIDLWLACLLFKQANTWAKSLLGINRLRAMFSAEWPGRFKLV